MGAAPAGVKRASSRSCTAASISAQAGEVTPTATPPGGVPAFRSLPISDELPPLDAPLSRGRDPTRAGHECGDAPLRLPRGLCTPLAPDDANAPEKCAAGQRGVRR